MTINGWLQILVFFAVVLAVTKPAGIFMTKVFSRERTWLDPVLRPVERLLYKVTGVDEEHEMRWTEYCISMLLFSAVSMLVLYLLQRVQQILPLNPQKFGGVAPDLAHALEIARAAAAALEAAAPEAAAMGGLRGVRGRLCVRAFPALRRGKVARLGHGSHILASRSNVSDEL